MKVEVQKHNRIHEQYLRTNRNISEKQIKKECMEWRIPAHLILNRIQRAALAALLLYDKFKVRLQIGHQEMPTDQYSLWHQLNKIQQRAAKAETDFIAVIQQIPNVEPEQDKDERQPQDMDLDEDHDNDQQEEDTQQIKQQPPVNLEEEVQQDIKVFLENQPTS